MDLWPTAGNSGNVKEGALKMLERPPASPKFVRAWPPGKCVKVQVWKLLSVITGTCKSTHLLNKWINTAYYLICSSTVFDTRIIYQEISCCLYKLSVLTKRFFFFFYSVFIFESMDKSVFLELKVGKIVRDYSFDTFSNRIKYRAERTLLTYANTVLLSWENCGCRKDKWQLTPNTYFQSLPNTLYKNDFVGLVICRGPSSESSLWFLKTWVMGGINQEIGVNLHTLYI